MYSSLIITSFQKQIVINCSVICLIVLTFAFHLRFICVTIAAVTYQQFSNILPLNCVHVLCTMYIIIQERRVLDLATCTNWRWTMDMETVCRSVFRISANTFSYLSTALRTKANKDTLANAYRILLLYWDKLLAKSMNWGLIKSVMRKNSQEAVRS